MRPLDEVFIAAGKLSLLKRLCVCSDAQTRFRPAAFNALTASSQLQSLTLGMAASTEGCRDKQIFHLFTAGDVYPHLHTLDLHSIDISPALPISLGQLLLLPKCCPAVDSLGLALGFEDPDVALPELQRLSALTELKLDILEEPAAAATVKVAAQLTALKCLALLGLPTPTAPSLLGLTALTALKLLEVGVRGAAEPVSLTLRTTVSA
jgi:hypothetical protein